MNIASWKTQNIRFIRSVLLLTHHLYNPCFEFEALQHSRSNPIITVYYYVFKNISRDVTHNGKVSYDPKIKSNWAKK